MFEQDTTDEVVDSSTTEGTDDGADDSSDTSDNTSSTETKTRKTVPYERFSEVNRKLKEAEAKLAGEGGKTTQETEPAKKPQKSETSSLSEEDLFAIKQLDSQEELERARKIAKLEEISLSEAISSDLFTSWKAQKAEEKKKEEVAMGASRGSGSRGKKKDLSTPGLSDKEHKEMFKRRMGIG